MKDSGSSRDASAPLGARNDDSSLFSLDSLKKAEEDAQKKSRAREDSGLIDLKALALLEREPAPKTDVVIASVVAPVDLFAVPAHFKSDSAPFVAPLTSPPISTAPPPLAAEVKTGRGKQLVVVVGALVAAAAAAAVFATTRGGPDAAAAPAATTSVAATPSVTATATADEPKPVAAVTPTVAPTATAAATALVATSKPVVGGPLKKAAPKEAPKEEAPPAKPAAEACDLACQMQRAVNKK